MESPFASLQGFIDRSEQRRFDLAATIEKLNQAQSLNGPNFKVPQGGNRGASGQSRGGRGSGGGKGTPKMGHAVMPIKGAGFTAGPAGDFGPRTNPVTGSSAYPHTGYDFSAGSGTKIRAVVGGRVVSAGWDPIYGWETIIKTKNGFTTQYGHQLVDPKRLEPGTRVKAGQVIGRVGSTGRSTGPHLHFGVENKAGEWIDPVKWLDRILGRT